jgi:hypothetical protein
MRSITAAATASGRASAIALAADRATTGVVWIGVIGDGACERLDSVNNIACSQFLPGSGQLPRGLLVGEQVERVSSRESRSSELMRTAVGSRPVEYLLVRRHERPSASVQPYGFVVSGAG